MDKDCLVWRSSNLWNSTIQVWTRHNAAKITLKKENILAKTFRPTWDICLMSGLVQPNKSLGERPKKCGTWRSVSEKKTSFHLGEIKKNSNFWSPTKPRDSWCPQPEKQGLQVSNGPGVSPTNPPTAWDTPCYQHPKSRCGSVSKTVGLVMVQAKGFCQKMWEDFV